MRPETLLRLAEIPNIAGVKEASGDLDQMMEILRNRPDRLQRSLPEDDSFAIPLMAMGGDGCISVVANQVPGLFARMIHRALDEDWKQARELHYRLYELMQANFLETNPVPVKAALSMMGLIEEVYRLPLVPHAARESPAAGRCSQEVGTDLKVVIMTPAELEELIPRHFARSPEELDAESRSLFEAFIPEPGWRRHPGRREERGALASQPLGKAGHPAGVQTGIGGGLLGQ